MEDIPAFLLRELTPEVQAKIKRITARYRDPKISNPPKRVSRRRQKLGPIFGSKIVKT